MDAGVETFCEEGGGTEDGADIEVEVEAGPETEVAAAVCAAIAVVAMSSDVRSRLVIASFWESNQY